MFELCLNLSKHSSNFQAASWAGFTLPVPWPCKGFYTMFSCLQGQGLSGNILKCYVTFYMLKGLLHHADESSFRVKVCGNFLGWETRRLYNSKGNVCGVFLGCKSTDDSCGC